MNILFQISDKDIMFIGLFGVGIILFGAIIFYVLSKGEKEEAISEEERFDNDEKEMFEEIKPKTKEQQEAKEELERVFKQMSADLETKSAPKAIEKFEQEQEENAIISYQELIKQAEAKRNHPNDDFEDIEEKLDEVTLVKEEKPKKEKKKKEVVTEKKFKNSEIISPIFGVQSPAEYKEELREKELLKETFEEDSTYEQTSNLEFLNSLKEFRGNL